MSDWNDTVKPVASKTYAELLKTHGAQVAAAVEALEIARRQAEITQTIEDWSKRHHLPLGAAADLLQAGQELFAGLCGEFGPQRAVHVLTGIEREHTRASWGADLRAWRKRGEMTVEAAARELGLAVEDVEAIEAGNFSAGPEVMRLVRPALRRVKSEL